MDNTLKFEDTDETSKEQNSVFMLESTSVNSGMEVIDQSAVDTEADNQQCMEVSPCFEKKKEVGVQSLFAPFNHHMRPDPEYIRLETERSASNQEAATKVINDRYKFIMENSARRKEKEQKDKVRFTQISHNVDHDKVTTATQLSHYADIDDNKKTTRLHNIHLASGFLTKNKSEEFSNDELEKIHWHSGLERFIKLDNNEINLNTNIFNIDMLMTITKDHECTMKDEDEENEGEKRIFYQAPLRLGSAKCKKTTQIFCDENEFIGSSFEELLRETPESFYEI